MFVSKNSLKMSFKNYWSLFFFYFIMCFQAVFFRFKRGNAVQSRKWLAAWHNILLKKIIFGFTSCQRPYHVEHTSSRPITEVKQHWARIVLRWETAWELLVLLAFLHFQYHFLWFYLFLLARTAWKWFFKLLFIIFLWFHNVFSSSFFPLLEWKCSAE